MLTLWNKVALVCVILRGTVRYPNSPHGAPPYKLTVYSLGVRHGRSVVESWKAVSANNLVDFCLDKLLDLRVCGEDVE